MPDNDKNKTTVVTPPVGGDAPKSDESKPKTALIKMQHEFKGDWTLRIDASEYEVKDGAVEVPAWHYDAAHLAGFR